MDKVIGLLIAVVLFFFIAEKQCNWYKIQITNYSGSKTWEQAKSIAGSSTFWWRWWWDLDPHKNIKAEWSKEKDSLHLIQNNGCMLLMYNRNGEDLYQTLTLTECHVWYIHCLGSRSRTDYNSDHTIKKHLQSPTAMLSTCTHSQGPLWTSQGLRVMLQLPEHIGYSYNHILNCRI